MMFGGASASTESSAGQQISQLMGITPQLSVTSVLSPEGLIDTSSLSSPGSEACGPTLQASRVADNSAANVQSLAPVDTTALNADGITVERLFVEENETAEPKVIGFLPFDTRFAVENDTLYAIGWSELKGYELAEIRDKGGPKIHNFNPEGDSFAGYPYYDDRTIKAFNDQLFFYAQNADGSYEFSSLKNGSARKELNADMGGPDIPRVYADDGSLTYRAGHIEKFGIYRDRLMSAGSLRVPLLLDDGSEVASARVFDLEPQRVTPGKKPSVEITDVYANGPARPRNMVEFNGAVYMIAKTAGGYSPCGPGRDYELVRLNDDGSSEVIEINPDGYGFYPGINYPPMQVIGDDLYLVANLGAPGSERHELVRVTPAHQVSVVPVNSDGGAFANIDELDYFYTSEIPALVRKFNGSLYILGANVAGECVQDQPGCSNPYINKIVKITAGGSVSVIDPASASGNTFVSFAPGWLPMEFLANEFANDLYFECGPCNENAMYRINADDTLEYFSEWVALPITRDHRTFDLGIERNGGFYTNTFRFDDDSNVIEPIIKVDSNGNLAALESSDFGYGYVYSMVLLGDTIVAGANIFTDPEKEWDEHFLGQELLIIHPDDTLGYVEVAPGFDESGWPYSSFPRGLSVVGDAVTFASYTDPTWESPFYELFRLHIGGKGNGKGKGKGSKNKSELTPLAPSADGSLVNQRAWPVAQPPENYVRNPGVPDFTRLMRIRSGNEEDLSPSHPVVLASEDQRARAQFFGRERVANRTDLEAAHRVQRSKGAGSDSMCRSSLE
ncbi:MAG: hypothetical protein OQJ84_04985 [Xanthomonadales bacterium]|nr:hypothetical protein [Xanthomonadales bacterium]